ncbi:hypothetical protein ACIBHY_17515 [Nonomuraea sp. NPDC050547]|uniref:hypothetical protein n=1 Tax=Nonomuraea sp. NPDC050547 TaxID=3364368 RepID=UPI0037B70C20
MIAVVVSLVAVVLLVLVVVALGMRSMNKRESSLPPERLKEMADREEMRTARSTDEFAAHEPRMNNFSPDFSPIDEVRQPRPVRTGQRGKRGVDEWGNPSSDDEDEEFWANIRSDAEEGGFGAGGTVAARKGASRPVNVDRPMGAPRPVKPEQPVSAAAEPDPNAATVQQPLPQRTPTPAPAAAKANLADLVEPTQHMEAVPSEAPAPPTRPSRRAKKAPAPTPAPSAADLSDQRTVTFAAPTSDVMSILGAGAQPVPPPPRQEPARQEPARNSGAFPAAPATPPPSPSFTPTNSGSFTAIPNGSLHGAPTSDPFPAYVNNAETWQSPVSPAPTASGSWPATPVRDVLDDPTPVTPGPADSWPAFEGAYAAPPANDFPNSYEVRAGWAVADDSEVTGPTPASGTPTAPARAVSAYDDVLAAPTAHPAPQPAPYPAYETGDYAPANAAAPGAAWPEPPAGGPGWPSYGEMYPSNGQEQQPARQGGRRRAPEQQDYPDYYR